MTTATFEGDVRGGKGGSGRTVTMIGHCDAFLQLAGSIPSLRLGLQLSPKLRESRV